MEKTGLYKGLDVYESSVVVLGSGAAGLNAASLLDQNGVKDLVIVTEAMNAGTSRNTGSDKQTYYKLSLGGDESDSVQAMAKDLFNGRCVDGDIALVEAALSSPSFIRLAQLGVPFPMNRYGEYVGYQTDHDKHKRATSAGPYTSKFMTECLQKDVVDRKIQILDGYQAVKLLVKDSQIRGLVLLNRGSSCFSVILCSALVLATGGPAGIYEMSVYPKSQFGSTGIAFEAGCIGKNLTEWQYGLASLDPRWNVSGSFMQVIPRFVSIDENNQEHEFLLEYPGLTYEQILYKVFLKGYQWPFDVRKLEGGSSIIDALCYLETEKGRKVYLDFTHNTMKGDFDLKALHPEARAYLEASNAVGQTPVQRLMKLNRPSYDFYMQKGVDLEKQMLEIGLCAQHNNGGLAIDLWWQSNIKGVFPVGECAASHGVYRPGGSALNAGQCGSSRAARYIANKLDVFAKPCLDNLESQIDSIIHLDDNQSRNIDLMTLYNEAKRLMSLNGCAIRNKQKLEETLDWVQKAFADLDHVKLDNTSLWLYFELRNALITQKVYLSSMIDYMDHGGKSRGSSLYTDETGTIKPKGLDNRFVYDLEKEDEESLIQEVQYKDGKLEFSRRKPRPLPGNDDFFENIWADYLKTGCVW